MKPSLTTTVIVVSVLGIGILAYLFLDQFKQFLCDYVNICPGDSPDTQNQPPITGDEGATGNQVPDTESVVNKVGTFLFGSSSLGETESYNTVIEHPLDTFKSLVGMN